ncbi:MAG: 16S rRNA (cytosine(1402)-N(4))-methyltransferase RsmH [Anaerolineae bacterium]|jgi:16S rRNA (cytosine1402-N4)-methyltransferase
MQRNHIPVLLDEVIDGLQVKPGGRYIDATVGGGGHAYEILAASSPDGVLLGLDRDPAALEAARARLASHAGRFKLVHGSFSHLAEVADEEDFVLVDGILIDLGLSSLQLADADRGFSFSVDGPLDMRFDTTSSDRTAAELVNLLSCEELADVLFRYGEERQSRRIARAIVEARPLQTTREVVDVIERAVRRRRSRIHPATLTFQALRIAVNGELKALDRALPQAVDLLVPNGRLVVMAFHSLEDRIVKRFIRQESRDCICPPGMPVCTCDHEATLDVITRKPLRPTNEEVSVNPRSRSARLRIAVRKT